MEWLKSTLFLLFVREDGNAAEYGLLIGLIAIAIVVGAGLLGTGLNTLFTNLGNWFTGLPIPAPV